MDLRDVSGQGRGKDARCFWLWSSSSSLSFRTDPWSWLLLRWNTCRPALWIFIFFFFRSGYKSTALLLVTNCGASQVVLPWSSTRLGSPLALRIFYCTVYVVLRDEFEKSCVQELRRNSRLQVKVVSTISRSSSLCRSWVTCCIKLLFWGILCMPLDQILVNKVVDQNIEKRFSYRNLLEAIRIARMLNSQ